MSAGAVKQNLRWPPIVAEAARIVESYEDTGVTLRQLFYRLVAAELLPNTTTAYSTLSDRTAVARRAGTFPALIDRGRAIHRHVWWDSPEKAREALRRQYRRDRTEGQRYTIYLGVEKSGMIAQLEHWFGDLGTPILALGGYASQSYVDDVRADAEQGRDSVLLYAGDFDPSGEDIPRDFAARAGCFAAVRRIALTPEQVDAYHLPEQMVKQKDTRAPKFVAKYGRGVVEMDALPPDVLSGLYRGAIVEFMDMSAYHESLAREAAEKARL